MKIQDKTVVSTADTDKQQRLEQIHNVQSLPVVTKLGGYFSENETWYSLSETELSAFYLMSWNDNYDLTAMVEGDPVWGDITILFQRREERESLDFLPTTAINHKVKEIAYTRVIATTTSGTVIDLCESECDNQGWTSLKEVLTLVRKYFGKKGEGIYAYCPVMGEFLPRLPFNRWVRHLEGLNAIYSESKNLVGFDYKIDNSSQTRQILRKWNDEKSLP